MLFACMARMQLHRGSVSESFLHSNVEHPLLYESEAACSITKSHNGQQSTS